VRRAIAAAVLLAAAGCAGLKPGATPEGLAVRASARDRAAARREAIESVLPLFLTASARREKTAVVEAAVFAKPDRFIGRAVFPKKKPAILEVRLNRLSAALRAAGLVVPPGYETGPELVLIALGDRKTGPDGAERLAADALETALFGRGIQAQNADDDLKKLDRPLKSKTETGTAAEALSGGWAWVVAGRVQITARQEESSALWKARARLSGALYGVGSSTPTAFESEGEVVDVSSGSAMTRAIETASQEAAVRADLEMSRSRAGRATIAVYLTGAKSQSYAAQVLRDLRRTPGVEGAAMVSWSDLDEMPLLHAYVKGLKADLLTARLLAGDASLRVGSIESEDGRIMLEGPEIPISEDRGN
jgi:hypothetical protein